jgi:hypothetical protein
MNLSKKIAILQSNYIPWKGYFDLINKVDEFVIYDDMQYTRRDWRNRNKIKTANGVKWVTIPVEVKGKYFQKIKETKIAEEGWSKKHWQIINQNYSKAEFFREYKDFFSELFLKCNFTFLSDANFHFIKGINEILDINTNIRWSSEFNLIDGQTEKLLGICKDLNATEYISGPAAKDYLDESLFEKENIKVSWMEYNNYKEYKQLNAPFEHGVSVVDLIFNEGANAKQFLGSF